jgi:hypothetical protein
VRRPVWTGLALAAMLGAASAASSQAGAPPDPATITLPDMTPTRDPGVIADGWKHFYFHKAGVSYAEAYADFAECYRFLPGAGVAGAPLPGFRPWRGPAPPTPNQVPGPQFGALGTAIILALVSGPLDRRALQSRMRRCMEPRGYVRYPLRAEIWRRLIDDYSTRSIAMQALAATGPAPDLPPVTR